jgi:RimJ/RimL family protein N-acetyltransferase
MLVTRLTPSHAKIYRALMLEAYECHPDAFTSSVAERSILPLSWWEGRLSADGSTSEIVFGAFAQEQLIGAVGLSFDTREKAKHKSTIFGMYVPDKFRKLGVGRRLIEEVLRYAKTRAGTTITQLTVTAGNTPALRLYKSAGFIQFGIEPFAVHIGTEYVSKVHMWCSHFPTSDKIFGPEDKPE